LQRRQPIDLSAVVSGTPIVGCSTCDRRRRARLSQILDLFEEDSWLNVYAGELEVRPPLGDSDAQASAIGESLATFR
jgi:hypothetical protein